MPGLARSLPPMAATMATTSGPSPSGSSGPFYSIDVECVATGTDHNTRSLAQLALVDQHMNVLLVRTANGMGG